MQIEIRAAQAHICGYVNVVERKSRPVITPHGKVIEEIGAGAFSDALTRAGNIAMTKDHNPEAVVAETRTGSLRLYEDNIGLHYDADISDAATVQEAREGKIKGLSFGMRNVKDTLEQRAGELPIRRIEALDLDHITLVISKTPCYSATSVEVRAEEEIEIETRTAGETVQITEAKEEKPEPSFFDNSAYRDRLLKIKKMEVKNDKH